MKKLQFKVSINAPVTKIYDFMLGKLGDEGKITRDTKFFDLFPELKETSRNEYCNLKLMDL